MFSREQQAATEQSQKSPEVPANHIANSARWLGPRTQAALMLNFLPAGARSRKTVVNEDPANTQH